MRRTFNMWLPNGLFGDPLVVVRPRLVPRVLLLDAGDTTVLGARTLLAVTDAFVSHAHVDHVFGLGRLLRLRLGRTDRPLCLYGPAGFTAQVRASLGAFTWNLVGAFPLDLSVVEVHSDHTERWRFPATSGFEAACEAHGPAPGDAPVLDDELLAVRARPLDHGGIPCLAWRVDEHVALNVDAVALAAAGLPTGPWLAALKDAVRRGADDATPIEIPGGGARPLGTLRGTVIRESAGDSVTYVTDVAPTPATVDAVARFARGSRRLVIETHFLDEDAALARQHGHLTAALAGTIARAAAPGALSPIHASTRYGAREADVLDEVARHAQPVPVELLPRGPEADDALVLDAEDGAFGAVPRGDA